MSSPWRDNSRPIALILSPMHSQHKSACALPLLSHIHEVTLGTTGQLESEACCRPTVPKASGQMSHLPCVTSAMCQAHNNIISSHSIFVERSFITLTLIFQMGTLGLREDESPAQNPIVYGRGGFEDQVCWTLNPGEPTSRLVETRLPRNPTGTNDWDTAQHFTLCKSKDS